MAALSSPLFHNCYFTVDSFVDRPHGMIDFDGAQALLLREASRMKASWPTERIAIDRAAGRVLAEDVRAEVPIPLFDYSAMDGYAVSTADLHGDGPFELSVAGESRTGGPEIRFEAGTSVRIFTGAKLPAGADAVLMQENAQRTADTIRFAASLRVGENVRRAGEDLRAGQTALERGTRISGFQLGLLATVERTEVLVAARPRVGILCTGDELRPPGRPGGAGLSESNSVSLAALVEQVGGTPFRLPLAPDSKESTVQALRAAAATCDVVLTVGGVSVGDHDVVRPALEALGGEIEFWKVRMKPGKPVMLARLGRALVLGLPGNPSSAQVTFALFGLPLLRAIQGDAEPVWRTRQLPLQTSVRQRAGRRNFYRGVIGEGGVRILDNQASGASTAMAWANCLVSIGEEVEELEPGSLVDVIAYTDL